LVKKLLTERERAVLQRGRGDQFRPDLFDASLKYYNSTALKNPAQGRKGSAIKQTQNRLQKRQLSRGSQKPLPKNALLRVSVG